MLLLVLKLVLRLSIFTLAIDRPVNPPLIQRFLVRSSVASKQRVTL